MLLICVDIAGLALFSTPMYGVVELVEYSIVPIVFLQLANTLSQGKLTRADFLYTPIAKADPAAAAVMDVFFFILGACVFAALSWGLWGDFINVFERGLYLGTSGIFVFPTWPFVLLTFVGSAALALRFALGALDNTFRIGSADLPRNRHYVIPVLIAGAIVFCGSAFIAITDLERTTLGIFAITILVIFVFAGMHVSVALCLVGATIVWLIRDNPAIALSSLKISATGTINKFDFAVVPLFVLMGFFTDISGIGRDAYRVAAWWTRKILGGLGIATVIANAVFAAITGISIASAAIFSRVAVPQMIAHGYTARFATGTVAGSSIMGMLIPPSLLLIIYGFVTETSVGMLFIAAIIPGILMMIFFCIVIILLTKLHPSFVGEMKSADGIEEETLLSSARRLFPIALLVAIVLGGIYTGWFTPTQAGAVGAVATLILAVIRRSLNFKILWQVLHESGQLSAAVLLLVIGASVLTKALAMSTLPSVLLDQVIRAEVSFWLVVLMFLIVILLMGMFLDSASIIVIAVPIAAPLVASLGADVVGPHVLIWFGIVTVIAVEVGLLTPPFGISAYVVKSAVGDLCGLKDIFIGTLPYVMASIILMLLCLFVPTITTLLL